MTTGLLTIEQMEQKYNSQVSRLLAYGFRGKFQTLTNMNDDELALFFEMLFEHDPNELFSRRMVALLDGNVVGTMSIQWKGDSNIKQRRTPFSWSSFKRFGTWNFLKMMIGLQFLEHNPHKGECYIADIVVHPDFRGLGVGTLLLQWAIDYVKAQPSLDVLSLYVSDNNKRASRLYEQLSFHTKYQVNSLTQYILFREPKWNYMVMKIK